MVFDRMTQSVVVQAILSELVDIEVWLQAEARLAAKRQARAEAREIRMRELERMQRENEDGVYDVYSTPGKVRFKYIL